jgi:phosphotriesterase-related protein
MGSIETVHGQVSERDLGATLMHEHIFIVNPELESNYPNPYWDEDQAVQAARAGLTELAAKGISTVVDLTVAGLGRCIPRIQQVAEGLAINLVVATGYYTKRDLPAYFQMHGPGRPAGGPEPLVEMFRTDIVEGIAGTGVKAGIIKVVTDIHGVTPDVRRVLEAAAIVSVETRTPITTHSSAAHRGGLEQQKIFAANGVELDRVVIGHCGDTTDVDYLCALMDNGSTIGLDRFGMNAHVTAEERIQTLLELLERGYAGRIVLSHDASYFSTNQEPHVRAHLHPDWKHTYIPDEILPTLRARGVEEHLVTQMLVDNPARILGFHALGWAAC